MKTEEKVLKNRNQTGTRTGEPCDHGRETCDLQLKVEEVWNLLYEEHEPSGDSEMIKVLLELWVCLRATPEDLTSQMKTRVPVPLWTLMFFLCSSGASGAQLVERVVQGPKGWWFRS